MKERKELQSTVEILSEHFLFSECSHELLESIKDKCAFAVCSAGEIITDDSKKHCLYILLSGNAAVYTRDENRDFLLRTVTGGDTLGVANLFVEEPFVSRVISLSEVRMLTVSVDAVRLLIQCDSTVSMKYILFLSDRIRFLNRRIAVLSAGSAERRLAAWLDSSCPREQIEFKIPISMSALATALGLGRASLYRAFDYLTDSGFIRREKELVTFTDRRAMISVCNLS
ncbi:MAG: Crp/Fnr family transcriptional regulator [Ruminococcaceae bacterium]|nr:Crp/Fnr family transcriptional regulator [Oscillospiraceae bacterium]